MQFDNVVIENVAYCQPPQWITSEAIEQYLASIYEGLKLPFGRLAMQSGIERRGYWPLGTPPSTIATLAGKKLLQQLGDKRQQVDLFINASVCRDQLEPATSSACHHQLELPSHCMNFDLNNACLGAVSAMVTAAGLIEASKIRKALIVVGENSAPLLFPTMDHLLELYQTGQLNRKNLKEHFASLTIGSMSAAILISHRNSVELGSNSLRADLLAVHTENHTEHFNLCAGDGNTQKLTMRTDSEKLMAAGVDLAQRCWYSFHDQNPEVVERIAHCFSHQVGVHHQKALFAKIPIPQKFDVITYPEFGNTGPAAIFLSMAQALERNMIEHGDYAIGLGIGSGLNCSIFSMKWWRD